MRQAILDLWTQVLVVAAILLPIQGAPCAAANATEGSSIDEKKLTVAKHLTDWLQKTLYEKRAIVAVVARKGGNDVKGRDWTGMAHSGLAIYDPRAQTWILYQLLNTGQSIPPSCDLWRMAPLDFFYGQTGYEENALILIPDHETQDRVYDAVLTGKVRKLAFTSKYNLLSQYDSTDSLNCNKWILMALAAARTDDYDPQHVLATIRQGFKPGRLHMNFIEKAVVKRKKNVRKDELPTFGAVQTVTPQSLYDSGLFEEKLFAAPVKQ